MAEVGFGGAGGSAYTDSSPITSGPIGLPGGRAMFNGSVVAMIYAVRAQVAGRGAARNISFALGSAATGTFAVGAASHSVPSTGYVATNYWLVNGGTANLVVGIAGQVNYDRAGGGTTTHGSGTSFSGVIGGAYAYLLPPTEPRNVTASSSLPGRLDVSFIAEADNGGTATTDYVIQYATNAAFTTGVGTVTSTSGTVAITGLIPGTKYWVRVMARNLVTATAGTWGMPSAVASATLKAGGRRWDGAAEVATAAAMRWDGTQEVPIVTAVRWDGSAEVPLT